MKLNDFGDVKKVTALVTSSINGKKAVAAKYYLRGHSLTSSNISMGTKLKVELSAPLYSFLLFTLTIVFIH